jgi:hypothetical protein
VFLDEIGEMTAGLQAKLLRFREEKSFKRVGGSADIRVDVRVIAATNRNLRRGKGGIGRPAHPCALTEALAGTSAWAVVRRPGGIARTTVRVRHSSR